MKRLSVPLLLVVLALGGGSRASAQAPANDQFADRLTVAGAFPIIVAGSTIDSTAEAGEPDHAFDFDSDFPNRASNSVWYSWMATVTGSVSFAVENLDFDATIAVYSGDILTSLTLEGYADRFFIAPEVAIANVQAGVTYAIAVDGFSTTPGVIEPDGEGSFELVIDEIPRPSNDDFANAVVLSVSLPSIDESGTNVGASAEAGEPDHAFEEASGFPGNRASNSAWYQWTAAQSGPVVASVYGPSSFDPVIAVYSGDAVDSLNPLSAADAFGRGGRERAIFTAEAGTTYSIAVDTYSIDELPVPGDTFTVVISEVPPNDQFAQRLNLGASLPVLGVAGSTIGASVEAGEPEHSPATGNFSSSTVWYAWTAPESALVGVNVSSARADNVIAVYTGITLESLSEVVAADAWPPPLAERAVFEAVAGTEYLIAVDAYVPNSTRDSGDEGLFELEIYVVPPNNDFADAEDLLDLALPLVRSGTTSNANIEYFVFDGFLFPEPEHANSIGGNFSSNSVWYKWEASASGDVEVRLRDLAFDGVLAVYVGSSLDTLTEIGASDLEGEGVPESVAIGAIAGQIYVIVVDVYSADGEDAGGGAFTLELRDPAISGPYDTWIEGFPSLSGADAARGASPSGDGVSNLVKLVLGLDPTLSLAEDPSRGNFPTLISFNGNPALQYTVVPGNLGAGPSAIQHDGQISTDLGSWLDSTATNIGGDVWVIELDQTGVEARYGRLKAIDPAG